MSRIILQQLAQALPDDILPAEWQTFDWAAFSGDIRLYDYQQTALRLAIKALWRYFHGRGLGDDAGAEALKRAFWQWYADFSPNLDLSLSVNRRSKTGRAQAKLLAAYYPLADDDKKLDFVHFINRMSFWMATGSGKTIVLVKLVELLYLLMKRGAIPQRDILILTHRDDLLAQIGAHVALFNREAGGKSERPYLRLRELKNYADVKYGRPSLLGGQELNVFTYRADNLSDVQKERIIDFRNYDNNGAWYVLLDEAHRGDREESKRQHIFSILSRNGFLFNFSATFTDARDVATTAANYNLSEFIRAGRGKRIAILQQNVRQFRQKRADFSDDEKQAVVLKALLLLAYARQAAGAVHAIQGNLYHRPLLMTLVNSVNTKDADLKLFFRELSRIGNGQIDTAVWQKAVDDLAAELGSQTYIFDGEKTPVDVDSLKAITPEMLLEQVFNAPEAGEIEVLARPSNRREIAFKLKTAVEPFALIRIGDISGWLKTELAGYDINERYADETLFERLNRPDSTINVLLGSRSFYEGWDSNRPNVIMYINIGTSTNAQKFILQSIGRGARIEPLPGRRRRLSWLNAAGQVEQALFDQIKEQVTPLESVFVLGASAPVLRHVLDTLDQEREAAGGQEIALERNDAAIAGQPLLIPVFRDSPAAQERAKFLLTADDQALVRRFVNHVADDRVFMALFDTRPSQITALRDTVAAPDNHFNENNARPYKNLNVLIRRLLDYQTLVGRELETFKALEDEIRHYRHIRVSLADIRDLEDKIRRVINAPTQEQKDQAWQDALDGKLTRQEYEAVIKADVSNLDFTPSGKTTLNIRRVVNHYYIPLLVSKEERIDYIRSVIHHPSERKFLNQLESYLKNTPDNAFEKLDWWLFSRIDEHQDDVGLPYYNPQANRMANFKPDFVFWLKKGIQYRILFVDPKGTAHVSYQHKLDGYSKLFEESGGQVKTIRHGGLQVRVLVALYTADKIDAPAGYKRFWQDSMAGLGKFIDDQFD